MTTTTVMPQSSQQLLDSYTREMILLAGKDGVGKSCAIVSMAAFVAMTQPQAQFHVIDSEYKFGTAVKSFGADAPLNITYWPVDTIDKAIASLDAIIRQHKPGDWLAVESEAKLWEIAQSETYIETTGLSKKEFLALKTNETSPTGAIRKGGPIPDPKLFWPQCKAGHDGLFLNRIIACTDLNCIITTIVKKDDDRFQNKDKAIIRAELGIDCNLGGPPSLPYMPQTMCLLELTQGRVTCRVLRDNHSKRDDTRPTLPVPDRKSWALTFMSECR